MEKGAYCKTHKRIRKTYLLQTVILFFVFCLFYAFDLSVHLLNGFALYKNPRNASFGAEFHTRYLQFSLL